MVDREPQVLRNVSFPVSVRGYSREAVDAYVQRVNREIAELEMTSSTEAAVKRALARVGEQTSGILQRARDSEQEILRSAREEAEETVGRARAEEERLVGGAREEADGLVARARAEAGEILARARAEAAELVREAEDEAATLREQADEWMHQLRADTEAIAEARRSLLSDIGEMGARFDEVAQWAAARFPAREPSQWPPPRSPEADATAAAPNR